MNGFTRCLWCILWVSLTHTNAHDGEHMRNACFLFDNELQCNGHKRIGCYWEYTQCITHIDDDIHVAYVMDGALSYATDFEDQLHHITPPSSMIGIFYHHTSLDTSLSTQTQTQRIRNNLHQIRHLQNIFLVVFNGNEDLLCPIEDFMDSIGVSAVIMLYDIQSSTHHITCLNHTNRVYLLNYMESQIPYIVSRISWDLHSIVMTNKRNLLETPSNNTRETNPLAATPTISPTLLHPTTENPTAYPTIEPTPHPTRIPTPLPTKKPVLLHVPTRQPTSAPSSAPTLTPTSDPTNQTSNTPTGIPTIHPVNEPSVIPTSNPTSDPTANPTDEPTPHPTRVPITAYPTVSPTVNPSHVPTVIPTSHTSHEPSLSPFTQRPTNLPTLSSAIPSQIPTFNPSESPTFDPTKTPTLVPTKYPTDKRTFVPTSAPIQATIPTYSPISHPSTESPTHQPTTDEHTFNPTSGPSNDPTQFSSLTPSASPTFGPIVQPTHVPSQHPVTPPTDEPIPYPTRNPNLQPFISPTNTPSYITSQWPSHKPDDCELPYEIRPCSCFNNKQDCDPLVRPDCLWEDEIPFVLITDPKSWQQAELYCLENFGTHLVSIIDANDMKDAVSSVLDTTNIAWIGLSSHKEPCQTTTDTEASLRCQWVNFNGDLTRMNVCNVASYGGIQWSYMYQCNANRNGVIQSWYKGNSECTGTASEQTDITSKTIDFNCDSNAICSNYVQIKKYDTPDHNCKPQIDSYRMSELIVDECFVDRYNMWQSITCNTHQNGYIVTYYHGSICSDEHIWKVDEIPQTFCGDTHAFQQVQECVSSPTLDTIDNKECICMQWMWIDGTECESSKYTSLPSITPTINPTQIPTITPTFFPIHVFHPTVESPTNTPSATDPPTSMPTSLPTAYPSWSPTVAPTGSPIVLPVLSLNALDEPWVNMNGTASPISRCNTWTHGGEVRSYMYSCSGDGVLQNWFMDTSDCTGEYHSQTHANVIDYNCNHGLVAPNTLIIKQYNLHECDVDAQNDAYYKKVQYILDRCIRDSNNASYIYHCSGNGGYVIHTYNDAFCTETELRHTQYINAMQCIDNRMQSVLECNSDQIIHHANLSISQLTVDARTEPIHNALVCWSTTNEASYTGYYDGNWNNIPGDVCDHTDTDVGEVRDTCYFEVKLGQLKWKRSCIHHTKCPNNSTMGCIEDNKDIKCCCDSNYCNQYTDAATKGYVDIPSQTASPRRLLSQMDRTSCTSFWSGDVDLSLNYNQCAGFAVQEKRFVPLHCDKPLSFLCTKELQRRRTGVCRSIPLEPTCNDMDIIFVVDIGCMIDDNQCQTRQEAFSEMILSLKALNASNINIGYVVYTQSYGVTTIHLNDYDYDTNVNELVHSVKQQLCYIPGKGSVYAGIEEAIHEFELNGTPSNRKRIIVSTGCMDEDMVRDPCAFADYGMAPLIVSGHEVEFMIVNSIGHVESNIVDPYHHLSCLSMSEDALFVLETYDVDEWKQMMHRLRNTMCGIQTRDTEAPSSSPTKVETLLPTLNPTIPLPTRKLPTNRPTRARRP